MLSARSALTLGSEWVGGGLDDTLRRKDTICAGDTNSGDAFDAALEWEVFAQDTFGGLGSHTANCGPVEPKINEFSASTAGTDVEYIEFYGEPNTDYSAYKLLEIEGDFSGTAIGTVDEVVSLGTSDANGFYLVNLPANALENGTITLLLVKNFSGALGNDLDTDENGTLDIKPGIPLWTQLPFTMAAQPTRPTVCHPFRSRLRCGTLRSRWRITLPGWI